MFSTNHLGRRRAASLPGKLGEEPLDAEDTEDCSQRAAEGGCAAPAPSGSERLGGTAARDATVPESRSPQIPFKTHQSRATPSARPPSATLCEQSLCGPLRQRLFKQP